MGPVKRLRWLAVRTALPAMALGGALAWTVSAPALEGWIIGGAAGVAAFWMHARQFERTLDARPGEIPALFSRWSLLRPALYLAALLAAYGRDTENMHGILAAAAGLFVIRFVLIFLALTGRDLKPGGEATAPEQDAEP